MNASPIIIKILQDMARSITTKFASSVPGQPEDQLKAPVDVYLQSMAWVVGRKLVAKTESTVTDVGRPDFGVALDGLLTGHVELKAPGSGANTRRFTGHDKDQWNRFKALPNILYTDGNEWALYRKGLRVGDIVHLSGDVTTDGIAAVSASDAASLNVLIADFFSWNPIVPEHPKQLANILAPLCRFLRGTVRDIVKHPQSAMHQLLVDWRNYLFPNADEDEFADAYAQTLVYAMLLAHLGGLGIVNTAAASKRLEQDHNLLGSVLRVLADPQARAEIETPIALIERAISAVDVAELNRSGDPWIYFYEDFLASYDADLRRNRGVYYTPAEVVKCQVALVREILRCELKKANSFAEPEVVVLDPAAGTGAYPLAIIESAAQDAQAAYGTGILPQTATTLACNLHAFEVLVGPYSVARLRITERLTAYSAELPADGVHVYLTDTLQSPFEILPGNLPLLYRQLTQELTRALAVKRDTTVVVCIGNPPYDREQRDSPNGLEQRRKGGWVRHGVKQEGLRAILDDFIAPAKASGNGIHVKNLYNDYVYFWRWALWKVLETSKDSGIVAFITAASYLRGPGFVGMRELMRRQFDKIYILDLGGDNRGPRPTPNVFAIQTPVCIAIGVRIGSGDLNKPAETFYTQVSGEDRDSKLSQLSQITKRSDLTWDVCFDGLQDPFYPAKFTAYYSLPTLAVLLPWQISGSQVKRTWPIAEKSSTLFDRWNALLSATDRGKAFKESRDRKIDRRYKPLPNRPARVPLKNEPATASLEQPVRYGYRSFDRRWIIPDNRLGDFLRPSLWRIAGPTQVYLATMFETTLGTGPAATVSAEVPDLHYFRGDFGGADIVPMWRDTAALVPNSNQEFLSRLSKDFKGQIASDSLFTYCYAIMSSTEYTKEYWDELGFFEPRIPVTKDRQLFEEISEHGRSLIWLHSFAQRYVSGSSRPAHVQQGQCRSTKSASTLPADHPSNFSYDPDTATLTIGDGQYAPLNQAVWNFSVSGYSVIENWINARMAQGSGKHSSPLDSVRRLGWDATLTIELLELIWTLEHTVAQLPKSKQLFRQVLNGSVYLSSDVPVPSDAELGEHEDDESTEVRLL